MFKKSFLLIFLLPISLSKSVKKRTSGLCSHYLTAYFDGNEEHQEQCIWGGEHIPDYCPNTKHFQRLRGTMRQLAKDGKDYEDNIPVISPLINMDFPIYRPNVFYDFCLRQYVDLTGEVDDHFQRVLDSCYKNDPTPLYCPNGHFDPYLSWVRRMRQKNVLLKKTEEDYDPCINFLKVYHDTTYEKLMVCIEYDQPMHFCPKNDPRLQTFVDKIRSKKPRTYLGKDYELHSEDSDYLLTDTYDDYALDAITYNPPTFFDVCLNKNLKNDSKDWRMRRVFDACYTSKKLPNFCPKEDKYLALVRYNHHNGKDLLTRIT